MYDIVFLCKFDFHVEFVYERKLLTFVWQLLNFSLSIFSVKCQSTLQLPTGFASKTQFIDRLNFQDQGIQMWIQLVYTK